MSETVALVSAYSAPFPVNFRRDAWVRRIALPLTYATGDLHGRFDLLEKALSAIADHATLPATLVMLGDYVDHGPASRQIIQRLRGGLDHLHCTLVCLKGNHEDIMYRTCRKPIPPGWWLLNGGGDTLLSYGHIPQGAIDCSCVPDDDLDWIKGLPLLHVDKHRVYVHAWLDRDLDLNMQKTIKDIDDNLAMLWKIYADDDDGGHGSRHVVHGHHPNTHGPVLKTRRTNLDTFAWKTGRLVVGIFDDKKPGGPVDFIEVIGPPLRLWSLGRSERHL
jgi:serine/threonine protein phosphatase 1